MVEIASLNSLGGDVEDNLTPFAFQADIMSGTDRTRNALLRSLRCLGERGFALLTGRWRTLRHITASPGKIGDIARAAVVPHPFRVRLHHLNITVPGDVALRPERLALTQSPPCEVLEIRL